MTAGTPWIAVGRLTRAHGVKGEVALIPLSDVSSRFAPGSRVFVDSSPGRPLTVRASRPHRDRLLVTFEEVRDRTAAEALAGEYVFVPASSLPTLPEGEYWPHELMGCDVVTEDGGALGRIEEILRGPGNDVWVVRGHQGERLLPAVKEVVRSVDIASTRVVVDSGAIASDDAGP